MTQRFICIIRKEPGKLPELIRIMDNENSIQSQLGGYVEMFQVPMHLTDETENRQAVVLYDRDYMENCKSYNTKLFNHRFSGVLLIAGFDGEQLLDVPSWAKDEVFSKYKLR